MAKINLGKVGWLFRGAHNGTLTYTIYDVVTSGGSTYIALQSVPAGVAITNTAYWEPVALKGDTGNNGVYIGETEPTDPEVSVWIDPNGSLLDLSAINVTYDNTTSGMTAEDVQAAIDELNEILGDVSTALSEILGE